ncbi:MAG: tetratricopeptide repeat protein [Myxococcota bacterium]
MSRFARSPEAGLLLLLVAVAWLYAPALGFAFLSYDDPVYVSRNPHLAAGFTWESIRWAFTEAHAGNWHPLTWLSHMADVTVFGLAPAGHHAVNVALHGVNTALVFFALRTLTGRAGRSLAVAALFALHPLGIESVAWVAERKNLLSTSFGLLAIAAYAGPARRGPVRLGWVTVWMAASLLAKAMWVTLPFLLLLLDVWPLRRRESFARRVLEKWPLFALSVAASIVTYVVQAQAGAMEPAAALALGDRLAYLPLAYVGYLAHALWPLELAVLYPHPLLAEGAAIPWGAVAGAAAGLVAGTALAAFAYRRGRPAPAIGWLWFLGMLVPVSGVVQIGWQGLADRYAYVPLIGLLLAGVWAVADALERRAPADWRAPAALTAAVVVSALLAGATRAQLGFWRDSIPLFERAIAVTGPNPVMHNELGVALGGERRYGPAREQLEIAATLAPRWSVPPQNLGSLLRARERPEEALPHLEHSVALAPDQIGARIALANALLDLDRRAEARRHLEHALALDPEDPRARLFRARLQQLERGEP